MILIVNYVIFASLFFIIAFKHIDKSKSDIATILSVSTVALLWPIIVLTLIVTICVFFAQELWKSFNMER